MAKKRKTKRKRAPRKPKPEQPWSQREVEIVAELIVCQKPLDEIRKDATDTLGVPTAQVDVLLAQANAHILDRGSDHDAARERGTAILRLEIVYTRAIRGNDQRTALAAQKELSKLLDLYDGGGE